MIKKNKNKHFIGLVFFLALFVSKLFAQDTLLIKPFESVTCGNARFDLYLPLLKNKKVAVVTNVTGLVGKTSIVDTLLKLKVKVVKIFGPEHGFRSNADAGEKVASSIDKKTGLPIISLYGANKKPKKEQMAGIDIVIYDIQDIGVRFYTYISTMTYMMEACAETKKKFIVLDRPNPNGFYIDGPVMKDELKGFLGLHSVPLVYGMTCGEYAKMVNEEGWMKNRNMCELLVIPMRGYDRNASYDLPVHPSPNIPNSTAVLLYPSLGLFEGTIVGLGRGTDKPFQHIGHPDFKDTTYSFIPKASKISAKPKYLNEKCYGKDLSKEKYLTLHPRQIELSWIRLMALQLKRADFFDKYFASHAGNHDLEKQLVSRISLEDIRASWKAGLDSFKVIRKKYLLYPDIGQ
ncbi:MAG: DUF1343 domain-containing protein [Sphingobacteriaceae bacterium]|nr:DUF1343 domain-containing protein [Sphingobacteriaceae bacterium]